MTPVRDVFVIFLKKIRIYIKVSIINNNLVKYAPSREGLSLTG